MNQNDINCAFTEKVTELLDRGYQIYPGTMGGSQGEIAHIDLYKGDEIIRVLLDRMSGYGEKPDGIRLVVGRNTDHIRMNHFDTLGNTIWNNHLEIFSEIEFCQIGENYYTDMETGKVIQEKRDARQTARWESIRRDLPDAFKCAALKFVQRQPRMKSCKLSDITRVTRVNRSNWGKPRPRSTATKSKRTGKPSSCWRPATTDALKWRRMHHDEFIFWPSSISAGQALRQHGLGQCLDAFGCIRPG